MNGNGQLMTIDSLLDEESVPYFAIPALGDYYS